MNADVAANPRGDGGVGSAGVSPLSYGSILALLFVTYVLSVSFSTQWGLSLILFVQIGTVWIALRVSRARRAVRLFSTVVFGLAAVVAVAGLVTDDSSQMSGALFVASSVLYIVAPLSILRDIASRGHVDRETMFAAIDVYVFVGMLFAYVYQAIGTFDPPLFDGGGGASVAQTLFFSFTTLTTTGYGNFVPASVFGQTVAVIEMIGGPLFLVTAVAKVVTMWSPARWQAVQGEDAPPGT